METFLFWFKYSLSDFLNVKRKFLDFLHELILLSSSFIRGFGLD